MKIDFAGVSPSLVIVLPMILLATAAVPLVLRRLLAIIVALHRLQVLPAAKGSLAYQAVPLLTSAERSFFGVLQQAIGPDYRIFAKVRLADFVHPEKSPSRSAWQSAFNRIACKHVDFALCDPTTFRVVLIIELDDSTHGRFERSMRDNLVDAALANAGIPVLRVTAAHSYSLGQVRQQIDSFVRSPTENAIPSQN